MGRWPHGASDQPFRISAVEAIRDQLDAFAASGDITGTQTAKNLRNKLNQAIRFRDESRLAPYEAQIQEFIGQVRDYTPRSITPAASDKLVNEAQLLLAGLN